MSDSQSNWRPDDPNAPEITYQDYLLEKSTLAGNLIGLILYGTLRFLLTRPPTYANHFIVRSILGVLIVLFFKCMTALFSPVYRRSEGIKWGLASYTVIMFSLVTVYMATRLHVISVSYIDNRNYPDGPYSYLVDMSSGAVGLAYRITFRLNNWLADGLLVSPLLDPIARPGA